MNFEVIKLTKHTIDGSEKWVISEEDFIRLISKHKFTFRDLLTAGLSRSLWDNTLTYYGHDVNSIQGLREKPYKESRHGNTTFGFSAWIESTQLQRATNTQIKSYLNHLETYFPGFTGVYSTYREDPTEVSRVLGEYNKELLEVMSSLKLIHHRVRKWAVKVKKPYYKLISSKLNLRFSKLLDELGLRYLVEYRVGLYFFDFYLSDHHLFIEIDGGGHTGVNDIAKEELIKAPDKLLRLKIRDKHQLKKNYGHLKNIIREACGI